MQPGALRSKRVTMNTLTTARSGLENMEGRMRQDEGNFSSSCPFVVHIMPEPRKLPPHHSPGSTTPPLSHLNVFLAVISTRKFGGGGTLPFTLGEQEDESKLA